MIIFFSFDFDFFSSKVAHELQSFFFFDNTTFEKQSTKKRSNPVKKRKEAQCLSQNL